MLKCVQLSVALFFRQVSQNSTHIAFARVHTAFAIAAIAQAIGIARVVLDDGASNGVRDRSARSLLRAEGSYCVRLAVYAGPAGGVGGAGAGSVRSDGGRAHLRCLPEQAV